MMSMLEMFDVDMVDDKGMYLFERTLVVCMYREKTFVVRCTVCGREKTEIGTRFSFYRRYQTAHFDSDG
jgi:hypothetical protein